MNDTRQESLWAELLEMKSIGYLIRAKIEQNLSLVISNISSSFMGNRQLANHNTDDLRYNLNKICNLKFDKTGELPANIQLKFLKHRQRLNQQLLSNSEAMLSAVESLQKVLGLGAGHHLFARTRGCGSGCLRCCILCGLEVFFGHVKDQGSPLDECYVASVPNSCNS